MSVLIHTSVLSAYNTEKLTISSAFTPSLSPKSLLDAQFNGLNTLFILSPNISELNRDTMREYDLEFVERESQLIDAFSHPASSPPTTILLPPTSCVVPNTAILTETTMSGGPIIYPSGTVHTVGMNPFLIEILHATKTGYVGEDRVLDTDEAEVETSVSGKSGREEIITGKKAGLVSAMQTRDNVRIGFIGSQDMVKNDYWGTKINTMDGKR